MGEYTMNRLFVPLGTEHKIEDDDTLEILRSIGTNRVFVTPVVRIPFEKCDLRTEMINRIEKQIRYLGDNGFETAVWIGTLGYGGEVEQAAAQNYTRRIGVDGSSADDAFCPTDDGFSAAMCSIIRDIALTGTDMIMLDDELTLTVISSLGCTCKNHMRLFNDRVGREFEREEIKKIVFTGKPNGYRSAWLDTMGDTLRDFCKKLRNAADEINPEMRMGFASGCTSWDLDGVDALELTKILAGDTKPFLRLTGAPYWYAVRRFGKQPLANILETCRQQYAWLRESGEDIEFFTEADVYPRSRFHTSAAVNEAFDIGTKLSDGCDVLKYFTDYISWHERGYLDAHMRNRDVYDMISKSFDGKKAVGVRVYSDMKNLRNANLPVEFTNPGDIATMWYRLTPVIPSVNAVPTTYEGEGYFGMVYGENARNLDDSALKNGLVVDICAANILQKYGVDVGLRGFESTKVLREHFDDYGKTFYVFSDRGSYKIDVDDGAKVLSHLEGNGFSSPGSYIYENANGQRFLVYAFNSYETLLNSGFQLSQCRGRQLNDIARWLGGSRLPVECSDVPFLYSVCKEDDGSMAVGYLDCGEDDVYDAFVKINIPFDRGSVRFLNCTGRVCDGGVVIDYIKSFGFAGIEFDKITY